jgi:hypothetical protein
MLVGVTSAFLYSVEGMATFALTAAVAAGVVAAVAHVIVVTPAEPGSEVRDWDEGEEDEPPQQLLSYLDGERCLEDTAYRLRWVSREPSRVRFIALNLSIPATDPLVDRVVTVVNRLSLEGKYEFELRPEGSLLIRPARTEYLAQHPSFGELPGGDARADEYQLN